MSVYAPALNIRYYPVPKAACSTLKRVFYRLNHGEDFQGQGFHLVYPTPHFFKEKDLPRQPGEVRIAVVRDPIDRFLSAHRNRIFKHEEAAHWRLKKAGITPTLPAFPSVNEFADNLEAYQGMVESLRHHTEPMVHFLGEDPGFYDKLFWLSDLPALQDFLSAKAGQAVTLPHRQASDADEGMEELGAPQRAKLKAFYARDYAFLERAAPQLATAAG